MRQGNAEGVERAPRECEALRVAATRVEGVRTEQVKADRERG